MTYQPTKMERAKFSRLLAALTPTDAVFARYDEQIQDYAARNVDLLPKVSYQGREGRVIALRFHNSLLFGREYLVAHVEDRWLGEIAPGCDAIASPVTPPLVLVPARRFRARSSKFLSVLEHELVHVNQALLGRAPKLERQSSIRDALAGFFSVTRSEFEANLLQLTLDPALFPQRLGLSLEHWCVLRGWTNALEFAVIGVFCPPQMMGDFLDTLPGRAAKEFDRLKVSRRLAKWFSNAERHESFTTTAVEHQLKRYPALRSDRSILATVAWLRALGGGAPVRKPKSRLQNISKNAAN